MAEVVDRFPPRKTASSEWWQQWTDGQIWKLTKEDWGERYKSVESARIGGVHFAKAQGLDASRVQRADDNIYCQFRKSRLGNGDGQGMRVVAGGKRRGRPPKASAPESDTG
jgi:hypothetical protein